MDSGWRGAIVVPARADFSPEYIENRQGIPSRSMTRTHGPLKKNPNRRSSIPQQE